MALDLAFVLGFIETLHVDFADTLGASHNVGGIDSLVGGNHNKLLDAVLNRKVGNDLSAIDIVLHALAGVVFHHGDVLVGRGVEDIIGAERLEDGFHSVFLADRGNHGLSLDVRVFVGHHKADVVLRRLGLVD